MAVWQVLPLCPPGGTRSDVPYASWAALAGHPLLISLEDLVVDDLIDERDTRLAQPLDEGWANVAAAAEVKMPVLRKAVRRLRTGHPLHSAWVDFKAAEPWALEAARFSARRVAAGGRPWREWSAAHSSRKPADLAHVDAVLREPIEEALALFFLFERQWARLRRYAADRGIAILGDVPIYVLHDSADVWAHPEGWQLDDDRLPIDVAGAPPDVFSAMGQVWNMPLYDWERMAADDYAWWQARLRRALTHFDAVRLDHFRAFSAYWAVPYGACDARAGRWVKGPGAHFFETVKRRLGPLPLCAEDLGTIDDDVRALLAELEIPGMKILHYAFGEDAHNPYLPHNIRERAVVYPGNHDNNTNLGWWQGLDDHCRAHVQHYLGRHGDDISWDLIRVALSCPAELAVIQMQDILSLPEWARMNDPASYVRPVAERRNWRWRLKPCEASLALADRLRFLARLYGRERAGF